MNNKCVIVLVLLLCFTATGVAAVRSSIEFAPEDSWIKPQEAAYRKAVCLNGLWDFAPLPTPPGALENRDVPLRPATAAEWSKTPIKIPSPWNVNVWGPGRNVGEGTPHPYWPDSVFFPSYPRHWDGARLGWLRRSFTVDKTWTDKTVLLHFEAVGGECRVVLNGKPLAVHFDTWLPFDVDVTDALKWESPNELLVGVRGYSLFVQTDPTYSKFRHPFPNGSNTEQITGIWQDVYLTAVPKVRVADVFVRPNVSDGELVVHATIQNDTDQPTDVRLGGDISPWVNLAGKSVVDAPVPKWRLDEPVLKLEATTVNVPSRASAEVVLRRPVRGEFKFWSPRSPQLYTVVLAMNVNGVEADRKCTRFGWREITLQGRDILLNGERFQLFGDLLHPFGPYFQSRRFIWGYYTMIKDFGGNWVRPHAQVHPRAYLDLADEMGLFVLDETSVFGSSINLNPTPDAFWERYAEHFDGLVRRDRNHPSVVGWSFGNEMFAIPALNRMSKADTDAYYEKLAAIAPRATKLDPTRQWISCDGDEDLRGRLPVWTKHFGLSPEVAMLPELDKPLVVGEASGTYYARPGQLAKFNGDRAYENYVGRSEAMAMDVYQTVTQMARPKLAAFSASETSWFGIEHLPFGYADWSKLPTLRDGVFFDAPYRDGVPGIQIERLPPYAATFNPGWDPSLPLYRPLPMFEAMKAALNRPQPRPLPWDQIKVTPHTVMPPPANVPVARVAVLCRADSRLRSRLDALNVKRDSPDRADVLLIEAASVQRSTVDRVRLAVDGVLKRKGTVVWIIGDPKTDLSPVNPMLPAELQLTSRTATALVPGKPDPLTAGLTVPGLYFAEQEGDARNILHCGLDGPLAGKAKVLLTASDTDWSQFTSAPEYSKCAAVLIYERLQKPSGVALMRLPQDGGTIVVSAIAYDGATPATDALWTRLLGNLGVHADAPLIPNDGKPSSHDLLLDGPMN